MNHIFKAKAQMQLSKLDQENLAIKVNEWKAMLIFISGHKREKQRNTIKKNVKAVVVFQLKSWNMNKHCYEYTKSHGSRIS